VLIAALIWNLTTWWLRLPISSSHCLIGSLFGSGIMAAGIHGVAWTELAKVFAALIASPIIGFMVGGLLTWIAVNVSKNDNSLEKMQITNGKLAGINPRPPLSEGQTIYASNTQLLVKEPSVTAINKHKAAPSYMRWLHILSCSMVAFSHGSNDGQKTMGI